MSEPISSDRIEDTHQGKFLLALGMLIQGYAQTEFMLRHALEVRAGGRLDVVRVLMGTVGTSQVIDRLKEFLRLPDFLPISEADRADVRDALHHFGLITKLRDRLVHAGAHALDTGKLLIRPKAPARIDPDDLDEHLYETPMLYDMIIDLQLIETKIILHFDLFGSDPEPGVVERWRADAARPWRYKHRPPKTPNRQPRTNPG